MQGQQDDKGWLLTCDQNRQKQALKDAYNFLAQYIQQIYDDLILESIQKKLKKQNKQLSLETELKQCKKKQNRLLFSIDTKVKCLIFVKINPIYSSKIDPVLVVDRIMEDVNVRNKEITRFCHKILPVQRAFKAEHFKMLDVVDELFENKTEKGEVKSWALNFKCRNNSKFNYKEILVECTNIAQKYGHFPEIYYPQWTVSIQIVHHLMCICISQKYKEYNEYKLHKKISKQNNPRKDKIEVQNRKNSDQIQQKKEKQPQNNNGTEEDVLLTQQQLKQQLMKHNTQKPSASNVENAKIQQSVEQQNKESVERQKQRNENLKKQLHQEVFKKNYEDDDVQFF